MKKTTAAASCRPPFESVWLPRADERDIMSASCFLLPANLLTGSDRTCTCPGAGPSALHPKLDQSTRCAREDYRGGCGILPSNKWRDYLPDKKQVAHVWKKKQKTTGFDAQKRLSLCRKCNCLSEHLSSLSLVLASTTHTKKSYFVWSTSSVTW